jgi:exopolysaccharide biosynthesis polyprenyl glycosylphosphotransferase
MLRRFSINFAILSMVLDAMWVIFGLWIANTTRPLLNRLSFVQPIQDIVDLPVSLFFVFPIIWVSILSAYAIYDGRKYLRVVDEFATLTIASFVASISIAGILYLSFRQISRAMFLVFILIVYASFLGWRSIARLFFRLRKDWPDSPRQVLIVGAGPLGIRVRKQIEDVDIANMNCIGFVDDFDMTVDQTRPNLHLLGGIRNIRKVITDFTVTDVVIALPHSVYQRMGEVVSLINDLPVKVWVALGFFDLALYKTDIEDFAGIPMLDLRAAALSDYQLLVKRGFDLFFGSIALLLALPLIGFISLVIWLDDGRPIFFVQKRVGENGRVFDMYKFRTMVNDAEKLRALVEKTDENGNLIHKSASDPRVTRIGRFLRRFSLDELPQFFNVVTGTMSLVGPRPEMPYLVEKYQPWQRKRFAVPPGITGWWQINGRSERAMHLHTEDDLYYINNYSLWLDIQIIFRTMWTVLLGKGAF